MRKNTKQTEFEKNLELIWAISDKVDEYPEIFNEHIEENEIEFYTDMYSCLFKKYECNLKNLKRYENMVNEKIEMYAGK